MVKIVRIALILLFCFLVSSAQAGQNKEVFCLQDQCYTEQDIEYLSSLFAPVIKSNKGAFCRALLKLAVVEQEAKATGFLKRKDIQKKLALSQKNTLYRLFIDDLVQKTKIDDTILKSYYLAHLEEFSTPLQYEMAIFEFDSIPSKPFTLQNFKKLSKIVNKEYIADKELVVAFGKRMADDVYRLKKGNCLLFLNAQKKWKAVCLLDKIKPKTIDFEKVKSIIKKKLLNNKKGWLVDEEVKKLIQKYKPEIKESFCVIKDQ